MAAALIARPPMGLFRELRYELSSLIFGLGILGMFFSLTQYIIPSQSPDWLQSVHRAVGNYVVWEAFLGFLGPRRRLLLRRHAPERARVRTAHLDAIERGL